ncbi:Predicted DNA-binding protein, contains Ribbon-helix-helix (RHH) domain [Sulfitobacter marinus]|uniref:Predicted DNA-binding protein, contains Ribbon-helix-helix (RHH) domain n=1 Tax=Sulfitobacter marinus TaxID=394264 RepID=A0A1I6QUS1_9RHOB|nr:ribbon-helix-helix domain-containing protein [Sulfitobacter marinus]SFS56277.1 Predicted DNA-binding protein, contains Ribbon-helix-helix (RHH) domain [Sulfitobacter marinus]
MSARPVKHSVTLRGHRTSISLEDEFWSEFKEIAADLNLPINALVTKIDADRGMEAGLASAIRVFVLRSLKERLPTSE